MASVARNFNCPETDSPCHERNCKRGGPCVTKERSDVEARQAEELARQQRIRHGRYSPEDIGL